MMLTNTLTKVRARNAYLPTGPPRSESMGVQGTEGTGGFQTVPVTAARVLAVALQTTMVCVRGRSGGRIASRTTNSMAGSGRTGQQQHAWAQLRVELQFWHPKAPQNIVAWLRSILIPLEKLGYFIIQTVDPVAAKIEAYEVTFLNANWSAETAFAQVILVGRGVGSSTDIYYPYNASMYPSTPSVDIP